MMRLMPLYKEDETQDPKGRPCEDKIRKRVFTKNLTMLAL